MWWLCSFSHVSTQTCGDLSLGRTSQGGVGCVFLSSRLASSSKLPGSELARERERLLVCLGAARGKSVYWLQHGNSYNGFVN